MFIPNNDLNIASLLKRISVLHSNETLQYRHSAGQLWISLAKDQMHRFATVVKVELEDELKLVGGDR